MPGGSARLAGSPVERGWELDLQDPVSGVPADRLVPQTLGGFAVCADEKPLSFPPVAPIRLAGTGRGKVVTLACQSLPATGDTHPALGQPVVDFGKAGLEDLEALLLGKPLRLSGVPGDFPFLGTYRSGQTAGDLLCPGPQRRSLVVQIPLAELPSVVACAGDRTSPTRRRLGCQ